MSTACCSRCEMPLKVDPKAGSKAKLLKRAKTLKGYCIHCATHNWLRNTCPINLQLAEKGPQVLLVPAVREIFGKLMQGGNADAALDEINWNRIVEYWDLPFPEPIKPTGRNPVTQKDLDEIASGERPGLGQHDKRPDPLGGKMTIESFEDLNTLEPGLGDDLRTALHETLDRDEEEKPDEPSMEPQDEEEKRDQAIAKQKRLFEE